VLGLAGHPMRAREIHAAAQQLAGDTLLWTSVKAALAALLEELIGPDDANQLRMALGLGEHGASETAVVDATLGGLGSLSSTGGGEQSDPRILEALT
jgi:hypothetical protein